MRLSGVSARPGMISFRIPPTAHPRHKFCATFWKGLGLPSHTASHFPMTAQVLSPRRKLRGDGDVTTGWPSSPSPLADLLVARKLQAAGGRAVALQAALAEVNSAPRVVPAPCPQPGAPIPTPMHCSWPSLQGHAGLHAVWVIQAHKGVIKIHSELMSGFPVLMSVAERHSRRREKGFYFPALISRWGGRWGGRRVGFTV